MHVRQHNQERIQWSIKMKITAVTNSYKLHYDIGSYNWIQISIKVMAMFKIQCLINVMILYLSRHCAMSEAHVTNWIHSGNFKNWLKYLRGPRFFSRAPLKTYPGTVGTLGTLLGLLLFFHRIAMHFISCIVDLMFCCTVHYCLFSFSIFSLLATSSIG